MHLDSPGAAHVVADELEERGDPRAALVRTQLAGRDGAALISKHWSAWLGALAPSETLVRWKWGHVLELWVRDAPAEWTPQALWSNPATALVERLVLAPKVPSSGLERARALRQLVRFGAFEPVTLPALDTLTVDLDEAGAQRLHQLDAPRLEELHTRVAPEAEAALLASLGSASWFAGLRRWTHRASSARGLDGLLRNAPLVARGGAGLEVLCEAPVLDAAAAALQPALPRATFKRLPTPAAPVPPQYSHGPMETLVVPRTAPMDFRSRRAEESSSVPTLVSDHGVAVTVGSAVRLTNEFSSCSWCASANTRGVSRSYWKTAFEGEKAWHSRWEYECRDCGLFTAMGSNSN